MNAFTRLLTAAAVAAGLIAARPLAGDEPLAGIDPYIEAAMPKWQVPAVAIAVVKDGRVVLVRGYGVRKEGASEPVDGQTVFRLASITKTFAAASVALLVDEGKLAWDDQVKKHLPEFELYDPYLTQHTTL